MNNVSGTVRRLAASPHWQAADPPRIQPGGLRELGPRTWLVSKAGGWAMGGGDIRLLQVLGRHRPLLRAYLRFATGLVGLGRLPRADIELVTLRCTWNARGRYEFFHHIHLSRTGGLSIDTVRRVTEGPEAPGWSERQSALLTAADELHEHRMISDPTWTRLVAFLDEGQLVELCFLVGHYEMLAMLLRSAGVEPEEGAWQRGPLRWARPQDDSDALFDRRGAYLSRTLTKPIMALGLPLLPPYAVVVHRGRRSGREYRTMVTAFRTGRTLVIPLGHGTRTDWVRNLLDADRGGVERMGRLHRITNPRVTDIATDGDALPRLLRAQLRLMKILVADIEER